MNDRQASIRNGIKIELVTLVSVFIEASASLVAGILAGSALLIAFGFDSTLELFTAAVLLWRLRVEARGGDLEEVHRAEHSSHRIVAYALAVLCVYVLISSVWGLWFHVTPESSVIGIAVSLYAVIVMPYLAIKKRRIAHEIGSKALEGDAACSMTCAYMAGTVLVGLLCTWLFDWWFAQHVAGLVFLYWLVRETKESFAGHEH